MHVIDVGMNPPATEDESLGGGVHVLDVGMNPSSAPPLGVFLENPKIGQRKNQK